MERCQFCRANRPVIFGNDYEALVKHLRQFHSNTPNLVLRCNRGICPKTFSSFSNRASHISKYHPGEQPRINHAQENIVEENVVAQDIMEDEVPEAEDLVQNDEAVVENGNEDVQEPVNVGQPPDFLRETESEFLLSLSSKKIPYPVVQSVIENCENLVSAIVRKTVGTVNTALARQGIELNDHVNTEEVIRDCSKVFSDFKSSAKQKSHFWRDLGAIKPISVDLDIFGARARPANLHDNRAVGLRVEKSYYVPILEVLDKLLSHPDYPKLSDHNDNRLPNGFHQSYKDCLYFRTNNLFRNRPDALQILLYYDDVNLCDTASSRPVSMAYFYFTLANIHPRYRSRLEFIHLAIAVEKDYLTGRVESVLAPLVRDLRSLENGVMLNGNLVYGTVVACLGDNLAQHKLGGFKEGFTATHPCRYCMATIDEVRLMTREAENTLRTREMYNDQVQELANTPVGRARDILSQNFGLNGGSPLNDLRYFHVIGGLAPDPFHDHLYLQVSVHLQLLLRRLLVGRAKVMRCSDFNEMLMQHDFGYNETVPSKILDGHLDRDGKIHQSGAQMWSLAWTLPFIFGARVDFMDEFWMNFLDLLQISTLIMCHEFSDGLLDHLKFVIDRYYCSFLELFSDEHLLPRQHYLIHYPRIMSEMGPQYQFITFRFEAKHQFFKSLFRSLKCYKNPGSTSANYHEFTQAHTFRGSLLKPEYQGPVKVKSRLDLDFAYLLPEDQNVFPFVSWVEIFGTKFVAGKCYVLLGIQNGVPSFGFLRDILYINDEPKFLCKMAQTIQKDVHMCAYEVTLYGNNLNLISFNDLYIHTVFFTHLVDDKYFIPMKRSVGDLF